MTDAIITQLKTGKIKRVVSYDGKKPSPPYIVVKETADILNRGTAYIITVHYPKGYRTQLKNYVRNDVSNLLNDFIGVDADGNTNKLLFDQFAGMPELTDGNDDGTISMERVYYTPDILF